ncbi:probable ubiquitin carboxyl-terminal hydrolase MINDY-4 isoform X2 [Ptychodera flava]|uniref:probable ubiquitin carboxyl-terminal hydrolase MINDY-4 isoform X2 n=1 Tax=Ptychodera flava TaxID=63121 RepID=UPI003969ECB5
MDPTYIESLTASLVREYLARKGFKSTLETMDTEFPRTKASISNRVQLAKELNIEKLLKRNKEHETPFRTMLEVITKYLLDKLANKNASLSSASETSLTKERPSTSKSNRQEKASRTGTWDLEADMEVVDLGGLPQADLGPTHRTTTIKKSTTTRPAPRLEPEPDPVPARTDFHKPSPLLEDFKSPTFEENKFKEDKSPSRASRPISASQRNRGMSGLIVSSTDDHGKRRAKKTSNFTPSTLGSKLDFYLGNENPIDSSSDKIVEDKTDSVLERPTASKSRQNANKGSTKNKDNVITKILDQNHESTLLKEDKIMEEKKKTKSGSISEKPAPTFGDVEFGDVDEVETDFGDLKLGLVQKTQLKNIVDAKPITLQQAMELKNLVFGSPSAVFNSEWRNQGFEFCDKQRLEFGFVQHKGGPCGVLASVQACMLQHLLFGKDKVASIVSLEPTMEERSQALGEAIADILWRAGEKKQAVIALPSGRSIFSGGGRYKPDQLTETLVLNSFTKLDELLDFTKANVRVFESANCGGVILLLYSVILSRTIDNVIGDMDEPTNKLMGQHGYCTQEMVNLITTGAAVSNVFNDVIELDSGGTDVQILKGIKSRSDVGLLSLFEHYGSCEVGSNLKTPRFPIWVICSESHFSVLFCIKKILLSDWRAERRFDLYYYDGLARQEEEIKLTVDTTLNFVPPPEEELIPPIDHCIRTKWKGAVVDWNGTEPLL